MTCKSCREKRVQMYLDRGMAQAEAEKQADKIMPLIEKVLTKRPKCGCFSAFDEWTNYYLAKGFQKREARKLAKKLLKKLDARIKYEHLEFIPLLLLEKSGEGVHLYRRRVGRLERFRNEMYRWCFLTQWRATFWQSFKHRRLIWIGGGFNPDYTQACSACTKSGNCNVLGECGTAAQCYAYTTCNPICPDALANSTIVSNTCACVVGGCGCVKGACTGTIGTCATPTGICGYD